MPPDDDDEETDALAVVERAVEKAPVAISHRSRADDPGSALTRATKTLHVDDLVKSVITRLLVTFLTGELVDDYEGTRSPRSGRRPVN